ncbi:MAG: VWA domain-containing protein, partial [Verrucomicrobiae bacterium]|nr:VWA domain-containing protein [Verrucomicrobiae bacterium]
MKNRTILQTVLTLAFASSLSIASPAADPPRDEAVALSLKADRPLLNCGNSPQEVIIRIGVKGGEVAARGNHTPLNLSVVLDRSGSMTGAKLEQARQAAEMLVDRLAPDDIFSLVIYDTEVEVLIPPAPVGRSTAEIRRRIRGIEAGGSTALYAGVEAGGRQLAEFFDREHI